MTTTTAPRPLTEAQKGTLDALRRHGSWYPGKGWIWENRSTTVRLLDALVKKGFAVKVGMTTYVPA